MGRSSEAARAARHRRTYRLEQRTNDVSGVERAETMNHLAPNRRQSFRALSLAVGGGRRIPFGPSSAHSMCFETPRRGPNLLRESICVNPGVRLRRWSAFVLSFD